MPFDRRPLNLWPIEPHLDLRADPTETSRRFELSGVLIGRSHFDPSKKSLRPGCAHRRNQDQFRLVQKGHQVTRTKLPVDRFHQFGHPCIG